MQVPKSNSNLENGIINSDSSLQEADFGAKFLKLKHKT